MAGSGNRIISVAGATGMQGRAVVRQLLRQGWQARALTRKPAGRPARSLAALGAEVVHADMDDLASLLAAFADAQGVFSVQNHHVSGYDGEVRQGRNVADAAQRAGVSHVVYSAAGVGRRTGVGSWDTKVTVTEYARSRDVPLTVLRPMAFMELMTERKFFPPVTMWYLMPKLIGAARPLGWLAVEDLAAIVARAFTDPDHFIGQDLALAADVQSIDECREIWRDVMGRHPRPFPMPSWLFERFAGTDETTMWRWLQANDIDWATAATREIHPGAVTVRQWVARRRAPIVGVGVVHDVG